MLTRSRRLFDHIQLGRFGLVGLINTVVGYSVIIAALSFGAGDLLANVVGYAVGLATSWLLNRKWTFRGSARTGWSSAVPYVAVFAVAYAANLMIVLAAGELGYRESPLAHLAGIGVYAVLFYTGAVRFVFGERQGTPWRAFVRERWPEVLLLCVVGAAWLAMRHIPVSLDVVWQMWIARQLLGGAILGKDILEVNPPLWFWLAVPVQRAAELLGVLPKHAMIAAVFGYVVVAQLLFAALVAELKPRRRAWLLAVTTTAAIIVPLLDFAQREHLATIAALPYCALAARRADGREVSWWLAAAIGLFSAVGFALKHYFIVPLLLLELWVLWRRRRDWKPFRPELLMLGAAAACYAVAVCVAAPGYLTTMVPMVRLAYSGYETSLLFQLVKPFIIIWVVGAWILYTLRRHINSLTLAFIIGALGFAFCYFAQQKGFTNHGAVVTALLFVAFGSMLPIDGEKGVAVRLIAGAMVMPLVMVIQLGPYRNLHEEFVPRLLAGIERGKPVMMLTAHPSRIWPMVEDQGYVWPSRYFGMWMLTAFAKEMRTDGRLSLAMQDLAREVRAQTVVDLKCNPPEIIIVDDNSMTKAHGIDTLALFSEDEEFRRFFANYDKARTDKHPIFGGIFTSYVKRPGWQPDAPVIACRTIH